MPNLRVSVAMSLLLLLLVPLLAERMRNIDYLSLGYDIYRGNPLSTSGGVDPGFQLQKIFKFTYDEQQKSSDGRWEIPDHLTVAREDACSLEFFSSSIAGTSSYSHYLKTHASVSVSGWGAAFSASADYRELEERTSRYKDIYTTSKGECKVYTGRTDAYLPPRLSANFLAAVNSLPETYNDDAYMEFLFNFGTHYVLQVHMGARFSCVFRLSEKGWTSLLNKYVKVEAAASFSAFGISGALDTRTEQEKKLAQTFNSATNSTLLSVVGSRPVQKQGLIEWSKQVIEEPMPIRYNLAVISDIFDEKYMSSKEVKGNIKKLKANMQAGLQNYCSYLKKKGFLLSCSEPGPDPPFPKILNGCRFCAQSCGREFTVAGGKYEAKKDFNPFPYYSYSESCGLPFGQQAKYTGFNLLCCQSEDERRVGSCRMCVSCGNGYTENMGAAAMKFKRNYIQAHAYDKECHGEQRLRENVKPRLCCKKEPICSYCTTCGGDFPEETGVFFAPIRKSKLVLEFEGRAAECKGRFSGVIEQGKLCCKTKGDGVF